MCRKCLTNYLKKVSSTHNHYTRGSENNDLVNLKFETNTGKSTFHNTATQVWNALPPFLKKSNSLASFKKGLKIHFSAGQRWRKEHFHFLFIYLFLSSLIMPVYWPSYRQSSFIDDCFCLLFFIVVELVMSCFRVLGPDWKQDLWIFSRCFPFGPSAKMYPVLLCILLSNKIFNQSINPVIFE